MGVAGIPKSDFLNIHRWLIDRTYPNSSEKMTIYNAAVAQLITSFLSNSTQPATTISNPPIIGQAPVPTDSQAGEKRVKFAVAADALNAIRDGIVSTETYSSDNVSGEGGGSYTYFMNSEDVISFFNGSSGSDNGSGYILANNIYMQLLADPVIKTDLNNTIIALAYNENKNLKTIRDDAIALLAKGPEYAKFVWEFTNPQSTRSTEQKQIALQMIADDNFGLSILDPVAAEAVQKTLSYNLISSQLAAALNTPEKFISDQAGLVKNFSLAAERSAINLARSTNSTVKTAATSITSIASIISGEAKENQSAMVCELIRFNNITITNKSNKVSDSDINQTADKLFKNNITKKQQIISALRDFNNTGTLGVIGSGLAISALIMSIIEKTRSDKITEDDRISLASASLSIIAGLPAWRSFFGTVPRYMVSAWTKMWGAKAAIPEWYGADTAIALNFYPSTSTDTATLRTIDEAVRSAETGFSSANALNNSSTIEKNVTAEVQASIRQRFAGETALDLSASAAEARSNATKYSFVNIAGMQERSANLAKFVSVVSIVLSLASLTASFLNIYADAKKIAIGEGSIANTLSTISDSADAIGGVLGTISLVARVGWATPYVAGAGIFFFAVSTVFWLAAAIKGEIDRKNATKITREEFRKRMQRFEQYKLVNNWGVKVQFLAAYYQQLGCLQKGQGYADRITPANKSVLLVESDAFSKFSQLNWKSNAASAFRNVSKNMVLEGADGVTRSWWTNPMNCAP